MFGRKRPRCLLLSPREGDLIDVIGTGKCIVMESKVRTFVVRKANTRTLEDTFEVAPHVNIRYTKVEIAVAQ